MADKKTFAANIVVSSTLTIVAITLITVFAELRPLLKNWLTATFFHHWLGKSVLSLFIFVVFLILASLLIKKMGNLVFLIWFLIGVTGLCTLVLVLFFGFEALL